MDDKQPRRRQIRDFCKGFFLTLLFTVPVYAAALLLSTFGGRLLPQTEEVSESVERVPVAAAVKSYNLLFGVCDSEQENQLLSLALLRFDTGAYRVIVCDLPVSAVALDAKSPRTLRSIYASRGMLGLTAAVRDTLSVTVSGSIILGTDELAALIDELGPVDCNLAQDIVVQSADGLVVYSKHAGPSSCNGNDVAKLLLYGPQDGEARTRLNESLWESALSKYAVESFDEQLLDAYRQLADRLNTDVSAAGIYSLTRAVKAVCGDGAAQFELFRLDGAYLDDRFELAQDSDERFWVYFPKAA